MVPAHAQIPDTPTPEATSEQGEESGVQKLPSLEGKLNPPQYSNMDSNLNHIVQQVETGKFTAHAAATNAPLHQEESVAVTLYIAEGYIQTIRDFLEVNGASPRNIGIDYIEAYVPVSLLPDASQQEGVISIRTITPPQPAQGVVVSEGAALHGTPAWHAAGLKGQGVKIGVIDVGFEGFRNLMGTELPATVTARCYIAVGVSTNIIEHCTDNNDHESTRKHGTAVTEAIFDIAPDATYYIANTYSYGDMLNAVEWMVSQDVDVINHSVGWGLYGPGDGTSPYSDSPLYTVNTAVSGGIVWINAAGNSARTRWTGAFIDEQANGSHDFTTQDECAGITIELEPRERFSAQLRWDDAWGGASSDLDLYLIPPSASGRFAFTDAVAFSEEEQAGETDDIPYERISLGYGSIPNGEYCLAISHYDGVSPARMQLQAGGVRELEHYISDFSIGNPAESASPGLLAVGAARWSDTTTIEPFSSRGPTNDGRTKPDIVGADGGQSVSYRSADSPDGNWYGTSQASPHVAGLAALIKQRFPDYTPAQIASYLKDHADPRGAVPNNTWGYGFAKLAASDAATPIPEPTPDLIVDAPSVSSSSPAAGESFTLSVTVRNRGDKESSFTTLRYYRSTDATITTSDTSMGSDQVGSLDPSGSSPESIGLTAPSTPGTYYYGACVDADSDETDATNNCSTAVTVTVGGTPATWGAIRSFSPSYVEPEGQLVVTIEANNYGPFGGVTEVLPPGFDYVTSSLDSSAITFVEFLQHQEVTFTLLGVTSFTYTVVAPSTTGTYSFSGVLTNSERGEVPVGGALTIAVTAGDPLIVRYDANNNGTIEKNEVIAAINDYLFGGTDITKADVIRLINLYLFG